jgi:excisionase family DNA binding protein
MPALITITEFQKTYNVSRSTVYRLKDRNELPFVHIGRAVRIRRVDADKWYASLTGSEANDA